MMLQKDSLFKFRIDNLPSISGSKLYIGLLPVGIIGTNIVHLTRKKNDTRQDNNHYILLDVSQNLPFLDNSWKKSLARLEMRSSSSSNCIAISFI